MQSLQVMIVRCKRCRETEELFCSRLVATCNRAWLARANGWYVDQKKGTYCKRCTQEEVFYEEDRKQKQREAFGISGQDCHICGSCRVAASAQLRDGELDAPAPPPLFQLQADPEAAAAAGPQRTPSSSSSNDNWERVELTLNQRIGLLETVFHSYADEARLEACGGCGPTAVCVLSSSRCDLFWVVVLGSAVCVLRLRPHCVLRSAFTRNAVFAPLGPR